LAISKRLANMLGGDIQVLSEPGKGSTFTLTINPGPLEGVSMLDKDTAAEPCDAGVSPARAGGTPAPQIISGQPLGDGASADLTEAFAAELPTRSQFIQEALSEHNFDLLARLTHQLAGTAAIYGFTQVSDAARTIHRQVTEEEALQQIESSVAELASLCVSAQRNVAVPDRRVAGEVNS
jgi:HPt (histidine-containing phosphotransfer) domain-containing protein